MLNGIFCTGNPVDVDDDRAAANELATLSISDINIKSVFVIFVVYSVSCLNIGFILGSVTFVYKASTSCQCVSF